MTLGMQRASELAKRTSDFMLRRENDVLKSYLPRKREFTVFCGMSDIQLQCYEKIIKSTLPLVHTGSLMQGTILGILVLLGQVATHPSLAMGKDGNDTTSANKENEGGSFLVMNQIRSSFKNVWMASNAAKDVRVQDSGKLSVLFSILRLIMKKGEKVVVASGSTETLNLVERLCKAQHWATVRLDGTIDHVNRDAAVRMFNSATSAMVFLLSKRAGGTL